MAVNPFPPNVKDVIKIWFFRVPGNKVMTKIRSFTSRKNEISGSIGREALYFVQASRISSPMRWQPWSMATSQKKIGEGSGLRKLGKNLAGDLFLKHCVAKNGRSSKRKRTGDPGHEKVYLPTNWFHKNQPFMDRYIYNRPMGRSWGWDCGKLLCFVCRA